MKLPIPHYSSELFRWNKMQEGFAFLTDVCGKSNLYEKMYDDAEDRGFTVGSKRTGAVVTFVLEHISYSDPTEYIFISIPSERGGKYGEFKIRILNT